MACCVVVGWRVPIRATFYGIGSVQEEPRCNCRRSVQRGEVYEFPVPAHDELVIKCVFDDKFVMGWYRTFVNVATQHLFVYSCNETLLAHSQSHKELLR